MRHIGNLDAVPTPARHGKLARRTFLGTTRVCGELLGLLAPPSCPPPACCPHYGQTNGVCERAALS